MPKFPESWPRSREAHGSLGRGENCTSASPGICRNQCALPAVVAAHRLSIRNAPKPQTAGSGANPLTKPKLHMQIPQKENHMQMNETKAAHFVLLPGTLHGQIGQGQSERVGLNTISFPGSSSGALRHNPKGGVFENPTFPPWNLTVWNPPPISAAYLQKHLLILSSCHIDLIYRDLLILSGRHIDLMISSWYGGSRTLRGMDWENSLKGTLEHHTHIQLNFREEEIGNNKVHTGLFQKATPWLCVPLE